MHRLKHMRESSEISFVKKFQRYFLIYLKNVEVGEHEKLINRNTIIRGKS